MCSDAVEPIRHEQIEVLAKLVEEHFCIEFALDRWLDIRELVAFLQESGYQIVSPEDDGEKGGAK